MSESKRAKVVDHVVRGALLGYGRRLVRLEREVEELAAIVAEPKPGLQPSPPPPPKCSKCGGLLGEHRVIFGWHWCDKCQLPVPPSPPPPPKCPKCGSLGEYDDLYKRHYCRNGLCPRCNTAVDAPGYGAPLQKLGVGGRARVVACQYDDDVVRLVRQEDEHSAQWLVEWADGERSWIDIDDLKPLSDRQVKP